MFAISRVPSSSRRRESAVPTCRRLRVCVLQRIQIEHRLNAHLRYAKDRAVERDDPANHQIRTWRAWLDVVFGLVANLPHAEYAILYVLREIGTVLGAVRPPDS